jgi:hypothetical protein
MGAAEEAAGRVDVLPCAAPTICQDDSEQIAQGIWRPPSHRKRVLPGGWGPQVTRNRDAP